MERYNVFLTHRTQDGDAPILVSKMRDEGFKVYSAIWDPKTNKIVGSSAQAYREWMKSKYSLPSQHIMTAEQDERTLAKYIADVISRCDVQVVKGHADLNTAWIGYEIGLVKASDKSGCLYQYEPEPRSVFNMLDRRDTFPDLTKWIHSKLSRRRGDRR